jgi:hypothetical protein
MELCKARNCNIFAVCKGEFMHSVHNLLTYVMASVDVLVKGKIPKALYDLIPGHSFHSLSLTWH